MTHVLILPSWYPTAYAPMHGIFVKEQAEALAGAGHRVGVIYPDLRPVSVLGKGSIRTGYHQGKEGSLVVHRFLGLRAPKLHRMHRHRWLTRAERLYRRYVVAHGAPDLLHAHNSMWGGVAAARISRATGTPFVLTEHWSGYARNLVKPWHEAFLLEAIGRANAVLAVSESLRQNVAAYRGDGVVEVVPNVVDTGYFHPPSSLRPPSPFRFVCIASLVEGKAVDVLLHAFREAFVGDPSVCLEVVGGGRERSRLERIARSLGLTSQVTLLGTRDRAGVREALWAAHCCVSSSDIETFGVTLIEALATGLPIIATRSGGPEGIVTPDVGHLVPVRDGSALAEAMRAVYAAREYWQRRSEALGTLAEQRYGRAAIVGRLDAVYHGVLRARLHR